MSRWDVPFSWEWARTSDFAEIVAGGTPPAHDESNFAQDGIAWITPADLSGYMDEFISRGRRCLSPTGLAKSSARIVPAGSVLFTSRAPIGYCAIAANDICTNQGFKNLVLDDGLDPRFIRYYLIASKEYAESLSSGTTFMELSASRFAALEVPVAPLPEQRRIAAKIEALQARSRKAREALEAIPPLLEQFRQSVLAAAFRGDLTADWREQNPDVEPASVLLERIRTERRRKWEEAELAKFKAKGKTPKDDSWKAKYVEPEPVDDSDLPELPDGWCWANWREVGFCQNGSAFPSKHYTDHGTKLLRPGNLHVSGRLNWTADNTQCLPDKWADDYASFLIGPDELVMNLTAQSLKDEFLGRVCLAGIGERCLLNQRIARITPVLLSPQFCLFLFKSPVFRRYVDDLNTGSLIQHMFTSQVYDFVFPLPPRLEQDQIVLSIDSMVRKNEITSKNIAAATQGLPILDQSILAKAFRGELVPQDPNDEPASVLLERIKAERAEVTNGKPARGRRKRIAETLFDD